MLQLLFGWLWPQRAWRVAFATASAAIGADQNVQNKGRWTQFCDPLQKNWDDFTEGLFFKKIIGFKTCITITRTI